MTDPVSIIGLVLSSLSLLDQAVARATQIGKLVSRYRRVGHLLVQSRFELESQNLKLALWSEDMERKCRDAGCSNIDTGIRQLWGNDKCGAVIRLLTLAQSQVDQANTLLGLYNTASDQHENLHETVLSQDGNFKGASVKGDTSDQALTLSQQTIFEHARNISRVLARRRKVKWAISQQTELNEILESVRRYIADIYQLSEHLERRAERIRKDESGKVDLRSSLVGQDGVQHAGFAEAGLKHLEHVRWAAKSLHAAFASIQPTRVELVLDSQRQVPKPTTALLSPIRDPCIGTCPAPRLLCEEAICFSLLVTTLNDSATPSPVFSFLAESPYRSESIRKTDVSAASPMKLDILLSRLSIDGSSVSGSFNTIPDSSGTSAGIGQSLGIISDNNKVWMLEETSDNHLLHFLHQISVTALAQPRISLRSALSSAKSHKMSDATLFLWKRLDLASVLAHSILQFYSTPWIPLPLTSNDLYFSGPKNFHQPEASNLSALLQQKFGANPRQQSKRPMVDEPKTSFRELVYQLGLVLLELGTGHHYEALQESGNCPVRSWLDDQIRKSSLGMGYRKLLRACLLDDILDDPGSFEMEERFLKDVVIPLERFAEQARALYAG